MFKNNVFISYRWSDNADGWITKLHAYLEKRVLQLLGVRDARIWRDPQLEGGSALWQTLDAELDSAIFISILSPSYLTSDACLHEAKEFGARAQRTGGLLVDTSSRWIRIVKTPYDRTTEPDYLKAIETIELRFYAEIPQTDGRFREFSADEGKHGYEKFLELAEDLAQAVCRLLQKMARKLPKPSAPATRQKVFLADTTSDRTADRTFIASELGVDCDVVPAEPVPVTTVEEIQSRVAAAVTDCVLAVHVLGARFGARPEGEQVRSLVQIELDATAALRRLVWVPEDLTGVEPSQAALMQALESSQSATLEVIKSGRQAFLQHLQDVLRELRHPPEAAALGKSVYLVSDQKDLTRPQLGELANCLRQHGLIVDQPVFDGDIEELRDAEAQVLRDTTATIIYFGAARDSWVRSRRRQILKTLGDLNLADRYVRAIYVCSPDSDVKRAVYLSVPDRKLAEAGGPPLWILGDSTDFSCQKIDPLLDTLAGGRKHD